jgi:type IV secretory pathway VirB4 component
MKLNILVHKQKLPEESWLQNTVDYDEMRNALAPGIIREESDYIQLGENFSRTLVIINYPTKVKPNWLHSLYRFRGNLSISTHLVPKTADKMIDSISRSIEEYESRLASSINPRRRQDTELKLESSKQMLRKLMEGDNNTIYDVHMYLNLQAESLEELNRITKRLRTDLFKAGLTPYVPSTNMMPAFESCLPIMENKLPDLTYRNVDCSGLSSFFPFDEAVITSQSGIIKGEDSQGNVVLVDVWKFRSYNELIIGATGTGKSFALSTFMIRDYMQGIKIFAIDPDGEYRNLIQAIGGQNIIVSNMSNICINPLEIIYTIHENEDDEESNHISLLHEKLGRLKTFFKLIKSNLTPLEASKIETALIDTYNEKKIHWESDFSSLKPPDYPIFTDLYKTMEKMEDPKLADFMAIFKMYVNGSNAKMFNGHTKNVNLRSDAPINFDLKHLDPKGDVRGPAMFIILTYLWDEITKDKKTRKRLYVDEAHTLRDGENFLFDAFKRARKYKTGVTAASQNVSDFIQGGNQKDFTEAIIGNTFSKLLLPCEEIELPQINKNITKLSEEEERILSQDTKGEGIYIVGNNRVHMRIQATPAELKLIDPDQYDEKYNR